jgi:predicted lipoprotein with Yx(FWY)xxD motif
MPKIDRRNQKMKTKLLFFSLTLLALVASACGAATPIPATPTSVPAATTAPTTAPTVAVPVTGAGAEVDLSQGSSLGSFLVDSKGMTLYLYTKDTANTSNCSGQCLVNWPALLTTGAPTAGTGVDASLLGTIARSDGTKQVTYNQMPLYYFIGDKAAGDTKGQAVKSVWYVVDAAGKMITTAPAASGSGSGSSSGSGALVNVGQDATLGSFLVDSKGMSLYLYTKDTPNTSNCYDQCATYWPPLLTTGAPVPGTGVDDSKIGTTNRTDGTVQVTYAGWPLYYYIGDKAAGDVKGENVQNVWFVITPDGKQK